MVGEIELANVLWINQESGSDQGSEVQILSPTIPPIPGSQYKTQ
jgi:hypothetical protein